jgi:uncharacterized membrane protein
MNTSAFWIIVLGMWMFILHNRIKDLEKVVSRLREKERVRVLEREAPTIETTPPPKSVPEEKKVQEEVQEEVIKSAVSQFSAEYGVQKTDAEPSWMMHMLSNYFSGGNLLVRIGGVILFFGLAFLVKYAAEHSMISIQMRLWGISLAAVALIATGWKLRDREGAYGQILQGLGVAILYLVIYGASKFYGLLSLEMAFGLMLGVVVLGSLLSVIENALPLALFATAGGFLVPILTSSGEGSHVVLFSYYAFLNLGLFIVAWFRSWRVLNVVGFLFTFVIATAWGVLRYRAELFTTTEPFLILYFFMYLSISILFTVKHPYEPKNLVDSTLVFGLPITAFPLQISMVSVFEYGEAYSAVALGVLYAGLFFWLKNKERTNLLAHAFFALSVVFFTIAIPYIFDADVSAALWSLEGTAAIWSGIKQNRRITRCFGVLMLAVSIVVYHTALDDAYSISITEYMGYMIIMLSSLMAAYLLDTQKQKLPGFGALIAKIFLGTGIVLWFVASLRVIPPGYFYHGQDAMLILVLGASLLFVLAKYLSWKLLSNVLQGVLPLGILIFLSGMNQNIFDVHPFEGWGLWILGSLFVLHISMLYLYRSEWRYEKYLHLIGLWFFVLLGSLELHYHVKQLYQAEEYALLSFAVVPLLVSVGLLLPKVYKGWIEIQRENYQILGVGGLLIVLALWQLRAFGLASVGTYIPLFNLLDMMQCMVFAVMVYWAYRHKKVWSKEEKKTLYSLLAGIGFLLITVIFARVVHHNQGVAYSIDALWQNNYFQTGLSLLWSLIAIGFMVLSKRYMYRVLWLAGFGLLIVVILKLFFVELVNSGTIERIVSFMVVGTLLLLIGYFVPMPPNHEIKDGQNEKEK